MIKMEADTDLLMVCTSDISGQVRGKAIPRRAVSKRSEIGVGWVPTNAFITSFGTIAPSPWGVLGDLLLRPDFSSEVNIIEEDTGIRESFVLADILELDGSPWECCLRGQVKKALNRLEKDHGLRMVVAFEHEFYYTGTEQQVGLGYGLRAYRRLGAFPDNLMRILDQVGLGIDTFMPEFGPGQCEVTIDPKPALRAADEAVILRELVRATARSRGGRASFTPVVEPDGVGNGVHVHFSFQDLDGNPVSYDPSKPLDVSALAGAFVAGILKHLPEAISMTAASVPSYIRLQPNRWSAAFNNLGQQDREASVRICPVFGRTEASIAEKFHYEFRAADAAASPYLVLAMLINAGLSGLDNDLTTPPDTNINLSQLSKEELTKLGYQRLSPSLTKALDKLESSQWATDYFGKTFIQTFIIHKRCEAEMMADKSAAEICAMYFKAY